MVTPALVGLVFTELDRVRPAPSRTPPAIIAHERPFGLLDEHVGVHRDTDQVVRRVTGDDSVAALPQ